MDEYTAKILVGRELDQRFPFVYGDLDTLVVVDEETGDEARLTIDGDGKAELFSSNQGLLTELTTLLVENLNFTLRKTTSDGLLFFQPDSSKVFSYGGVVCSACQQLVEVREDAFGLYVPCLHDDWPYFDSSTELACPACGEAMPFPEKEATLLTEVQGWERRWSEA